jgi:phosphatidate cytidylyltransferase
MSSTHPSAPAVTPPNSGPSKLQVFGQRMLSTVILWGLLAAAVYFKLGWPFHILVGGLGLAAMAEYLKMDPTLPAGNRRWVMLMAVLYYAGVFATASGVCAVPLVAWDVLFGMLVLIGVFVPAFFRPLEGQKTLWQIMYPAFGWFYIIYLFSFVTRIIFHHWDSVLPQVGMLYALFLVASTKFTDAGAYAIGSLCGKHKMIPHISPAKSWEGLAGAFMGAILAGVITKLLTGNQLALLSMTEVVLVCVVIAGLTVAGDLAESLVKRCLGTKDSGQTLPGIGGAFDLIDSLLWTAPALYLYLIYVG